MNLLDNAGIKEKKYTHCAIARPAHTHRHTHIMNYIVSHGTCITVTVEHLCLIEDSFAVLVEEEGGLQEKVFNFFLSYSELLCMIDYSDCLCESLS